jgi:hypothetical protein
MFDAAALACLTNAKFSVPPTAACIDALRVKTYVTSGALARVDDRPCAGSTVAVHFLTRTWRNVTCITALSLRDDVPLVVPVGSGGAAVWDSAGRARRTASAGPAPAGTTKERAYARSPSRPRLSC